MGRLISLRGDGPWRGRSTRVTADRGGRTMRSIVNGYVSGDGHEIRQFPGFHTICDLTVENNERGYERRIVDSRRDVYDWSQSSSLYQYYAQNSTLTVVSFARPKHLHWFEQVRGVLVIGGESDFRKNPIYGEGRTEMGVVAVQISQSSLRWLLEFPTTPLSYSVSDASGGGGNGIAVGDVVFIEIDTAETPYTPARVAEINEMFCVVRSIFADGANPPREYVELDVVSAIAGTFTPALATGRVWRTRCNRNDIYPVSPNEPDAYKQIDDPDAFTTYAVKDRLDLDNPCTLRAEPAWVANRMRDHGDDAAASSFEGTNAAAVTSPVGDRSVSRRRQRPLPFVTVPEVAGSRVIVSAPGYACVFQCPVTVPIAGEDWPAPEEWSPGGGPGVQHWFNDLHDKPRALGVPKAWLLESVFTPFPSPETSPSAWTPPHNFMAHAIVAGGQAGWPAGTYRFSITYVDEITGQEGLTSEEVTVVVPAAPSGYSYGVRLYYMVPGYWFPETLALSINVYLATTSDEPLAYYKHFPLQNGGQTTPTLSSKYGISNVGSPEDPNQALWAAILLPPPLNTSPLTDARDAFRLAPENLQMPRGAECYRVIRGIGLAVGSLGTHGSHKELSYAKASARFDHRTPNFIVHENEVRIRGAGTPILDLTTPATARDGEFGIASRYFPPAYQGVGLFSNELYPAPRTLAILERMLNSRTNNLQTNEQPTKAFAATQRIRTTENIWDKDSSFSNAGGTPAVGSPFIQERLGKGVYMQQPRGQVQISEPGRPEVTISTAIQLIDPNADDDGVAIGNYRGQAIICSRKETFFLGWARFPGANDVQQVSNEHGCISARSMVTMEGGLAWLGDRGPCAMMDGFAWIGSDLEHDFHGAGARYAKDSEGRMRHAWGAHDASRGLVLWGLVTSDSSHQITYAGVTGTFSQHGDKGKSRFPANEVLVWSYRANAFSTWVPPAGLEIHWMRPLRDKNGVERMCFLAADMRIYALDDVWHDTNRTIISTSTTAPGSASTSLVVADAFEVDATGATTARGTGENLVRVGMPVIIRNPAGTIVAKTTVAAAVAATSTITLAAAQTWPALSTVQIGLRQDLRIVTSFVGETGDNLDVENVQVRYSLHGSGNESFCKVNAVKSDLRTGSTTLGYTEEPSVWESMGIAESDAYAARRAFGQGRANGPEISVDLTFAGAAQVRVADILLEVS